MTRISASFLAMVAIVITGGSAFGQFQQVSNGNAGTTYAGYQTSDWSNCQSCQNGGGYQGRGTGPHCAASCFGRKGFPDAGWSPPMHYPVNHDGAWYSTYHPQAYYGSPGGGFIANYPTVYQPNDTTQLGYSYLKVPTWQSRPGMIPPAPNPGSFHARGVMTGYNGSYGGGTGGYNGGHFHGHNGNCQNCNQGYTVQPQFTTPDGNKVVRPTQRRSGGFSLASLTEMFD